MWELYLRRHLPWALFFCVTLVMMVLGWRVDRRFATYWAYSVYAAVFAGVLAFAVTERFPRVALWFREKLAYRYRALVTHLTKDAPVGKK